MIHNEKLDACPVCAAPERTLLYRDLEDTTFRAAEGSWTLWRCQQCQCAYLDPRPDVATIGEAYRNYYTHADTPAGKVTLGELSSWRRFRHKLANGYVAWRYGEDVTPRSYWGVVVAMLVPSARHAIDSQYRNLPKKGSVLDVGCGNGEFIARLKSCGWDACGIDIDANAVAKARSAGVEAQVGGLELFAGQSERFDSITMHHVIEHFHDPVAALRDCYRLLKPGGVLWMATPNIDSYGHAHFGKFWRGLEAPRHLVLFNESSLRDAALRVGFSRWRRLPDPNVYELMAQTSYAMLQGHLPYDPEVELPEAHKIQAKRDRWRAALCPSRREFLLALAYK